MQAGHWVEEASPVPGGASFLDRCRVLSLLRVLSARRPHQTCARKAWRPQGGGSSPLPREPLLLPQGGFIQILPPSQAWLSCPPVGPGSHAAKQTSPPLLGRELPQIR